MGVAVRVTPLYGARSAARAHAFLLDVDGFVFLVDAGWDSRFDAAALDAALGPHLPRVDAVLLTHASLAHLGALPRACASLGLRPAVPVYATLPVWRLGQMFLYDAYQSAAALHPFPHFDLDDVDAAFEARGAAPRFRLLKYHEPCPLDLVAAHAGDPRARGVVVTAHPAGHTLGGAVWTVRKRAETVVVALDLNHRRENHLNPTALAAPASVPRPTHLVLAAANAPARTRPLRTAHLVAPILDAVRDAADVLIPVDSAARVIELAVELNDAWAANRATLARPHNPVPLVVLHEFAARTFDFARTMIEWMGDRVVNRFDNTRENMFNFKHLRTCHTRAEIDALPSPKVVLASSPCLEIGFARDLFIDWAPSPKNLVLLVDRPEDGTLAASVHTHAVDGQLFDSPAEGRMRVDQRNPFTLSISVQRKEELQGDDLRKWQEERKLERLRKEEEESARVAEEKERARMQDVESRAGIPQATGVSTAGQPPAGPLAVFGGNTGTTQTALPEVAQPALGGYGSGVLGAQLQSGNTGGVPGGKAVVDGSLPAGGPIPVAGAESAKVASGLGSESSSEDDDDDDDYDTAFVLGISAAGSAAGRRGGTGHLLGARQQHSTLLGSSAGRPSGGALPIGIGASSAGPGGGNAQGRPQPGGLPIGRNNGTDEESGRIQAGVSGERPEHVGWENGPERRSSTGGGTWDDYGQAIGVNRFAIGEDPAANLRARSKSQSGTGTRGTSGEEDSDEAGAGGQRGSAGRGQDKVEEIPTHFTSKDIELSVACRLVAVNRTGLSEGDALKHMVKELEPQRVVIVTGSEEETQHLDTYLSSALSPARARDATGRGGMRSKFSALSGDESAPSKKQKVEEQVKEKPFSIVVAPTNGETVDVTSSVTMQELTLDESVIGKLHWKKIGTSSIAYMDGSLNCGDPPENAVVVASQSSLRTKTEDRVSSTESDDQDADAAAAVDEAGVPVQETAGGSGPDPMDAPVVPRDGCREFLADPVGNPTVYVGTIMLSRLKDALIKAGMDAEVAEGVLCVQNEETGAVVLVKKVGLQNLVLEGSLSEEYYAVRDVLYDELVVVSAM